MFMVDETLMGHIFQLLFFGRVNIWFVNRFLESNPSKISSWLPSFLSKSPHFLPCPGLHCFLELLPVSVTLPFTAQSKVSIIHVFIWSFTIWGVEAVLCHCWQERDTNGLNHSLTLLPSVRWGDSSCRRRGDGEPVRILDFFPPWV